jgi:RNA-binding protein 26
VPTARRSRAEFSLAGPNQDRSITTVVVENIPEDKFQEETVRKFFSAFGNIQDVQMQGYKRLALVKYDDWASAKRAYDSPKVIFDNRFVKVYWYKPESVPKPPVSTNGTVKAGSPTPSKKASEGEMEIDMEDFKRRQEEAQRAHEEKMRKKKETEDAKKELEKRREELLRNQAEEKRRLMERLAAKTASGEAAASKSPSAPGTPGAEIGINGATANGGAEGKQVKASSQTEALRAQLAALEAEARSLGIDSTLSEDGWSARGRGRGRGAFRGRGSYAPRGYGGYDSFRGGYRGRGGPFAARGRGGAMKLDNRTKKVAVSGISFDSNKDESLRQYLLVRSFLSSIRERTQLILWCFRESASLKILNTILAVAIRRLLPSRTGLQPRRYTQFIPYSLHGVVLTAFFQFIYSGSDIPGVGKVELSWVNTPLPQVVVNKQPHEAFTLPPSSTASHDGGDAAMADGDMHKTTEDYDVAEDDDDRWMVH